MAARWWFSKLQLDAASRLAANRQVTMLSQRVRPAMGSSARVTDVVSEAVPFIVSRRTEPAAPPNLAAGEQMVICPAGEVDLATAPLLRTALQSAVDQHPQVCCDLAEVTFFSAAGVTALLIAHRHAIQAGSQLYVRRPQGVTRRVLHLAGVEQVLRIAPGPSTERCAPSGPPHWSSARSPGGV